jgi:hypothetical protein
LGHQFCTANDSELSVIPGGSLVNTPSDSTLAGTGFAQEQHPDRADCQFPYHYFDCPHVRTPGCQECGTELGSAHPRLDAISVMGCHLWAPWFREMFRLTQSAFQKSSSTTVAISRVAAATLSLEQSIMFSMN